MPKISKIEIGDIVELISGGFRGPAWNGVRGTVLKISTGEILIKIIFTPNKIHKSIGDSAVVNYPVRIINTTIPEYLK